MLVGQVLIGALWNLASEDSPICSCEVRGVGTFDCGTENIEDYTSEKEGRD